MKLVFKIIIGVAVLVMVGVIVTSQNNTKQENLQELNSQIQEPQQEEDSEIILEPKTKTVREILALASQYNTGRMWESTEMSEPTLVSSILENEESKASAYSIFQSELNLSDVQMNSLWTELESQNMVGEWESIIETIQTQELSQIAPGEEIPEGFITIEIPLITQEGDIGPFGCGSYMNLEAFQIPQTTGVLDEVYSKLFNELTANPEGYGVDIQNIVATQTNLSYESVELTNGNAKLHLSGVVMGSHCSDPAFQAQIEAAAFQFETVSSLTVYVNNEIFDWCSLDLSDGEGPCPENPKLWIVNQGDQIYQ